MKPTNPAARFVQLVAARDPRMSADSLLEYLAAMCLSRSSAVFSVASAGPMLFVGRRDHQGALDWTSQAWLEQQTHLRAGRRWEESGRVLLPVRRTEELVGLVYLETDIIDGSAVAEIVPLLAIALISGRERSPQSVVDTFLAETPAAEIERRHLEVLLRRHEWNVSRVARELGTTRMTVYRRMELHGLQRQGTQSGRGRHFIRRKISG